MQEMSRGHRQNLKRICHIASLRVVIYIIVYFIGGCEKRTSIAISLDISAVICYNGYERFFPFFTYRYKETSNSGYAAYDDYEQ